MGAKLAPIRPRHRPRRSRPTSRPSPAQLCRVNGLPRWPYRARMSLRSLRDKMQVGRAGGRAGRWGAPPKRWWWVGGHAADLRVECCWAPAGTSCSLLERPCTRPRAQAAHPAAINMSSIRQGYFGGAPGGERAAAADLLDAEFARLSRMNEGAIDEHVKLVRQGGGAGRGAAPGVRAGRQRRAPQAACVLGHKGAPAGAGIERRGADGSVVGSRMHGGVARQDASCRRSPAHALRQALLVGGGHAAHHQQLLHRAVLPRQRLAAWRERVGCSEVGPGSQQRAAASSCSAALPASGSSSQAAASTGVARRRPAAHPPWHAPEQGRLVLRRTPRLPRPHRAQARGAAPTGTGPACSSPP